MYNSLKLIGALEHRVVYGGGSLSDTGVKPTQTAIYVQWSEAQ